MYSWREMGKQKMVPTFTTLPYGNKGRRQSKTNDYLLRFADPID